MDKNSKNLSLSKKHIIWVSLIIGFIFTYTGVDEQLFEVIKHLDFIANFILNFLQAYLLIGLSYHLHFSRKWAFWPALLVVLGTFYIIEMISYSIFEYDTEDVTELITSSLPFGSLIILGFNLIYHLIRNQNLNGLEENQKETEIWFDTISGRIKVLEKNIRYAFLTDANLEIHTENSNLKAFYSLKQFEDLLTDKASFFRLNKQYLCRSTTISSFRSLPDGRLEVTLRDAEKCIVSKNKASSFKKWLDES